MLKSTATDIRLIATAIQTTAATARAIRHLATAIRLTAMAATATAIRLIAMAATTGPLLGRAIWAIASPGGLRSIAPAGAEAEHSKQSTERNNRVHTQEG